MGGCLAVFNKRVKRPIGPKFCMTTYMTPGKVYVQLKLNNFYLWTFLFKCSNLIKKTQTFEII